MNKKVLYPLSVAYQSLNDMYHTLYNKGIKNSKETPIFSVSIGNLTVGGTGKTPFTAYLLNLLNTKNTAVLSRGYGRKTKGFLELNASSTPSQVGEEPLMLFAQLKEKSRFFVCEDRLKGCNLIKKLYPDTQLIILDDAHQHRKIKPNISLVLTQYSNLFFEDTMLPHGRLRESQRGAKRADAFIITKCPANLKDTEKEAIKKAIIASAQKDVPVFFSSINYQSVSNHKQEQLPVGKEVVLMSAIANNEDFYNKIKEDYKVVHHYAFADHYAFKKSDFAPINKDTPIICTEKDLLKIKEVYSGANLYYLPLKFTLEDQKTFLEFYLRRFNEHKNKI